MNKIDYWVSSKLATGLVVARDGVITDSAPFFKKFIGQDFDNLIKWLSKISSDVQFKELNTNYEDQN